MAEWRWEAERRPRRDGAENYRSRQARVQRVRPAQPPRRYIVNLESHADAEQQRQRDDVSEVERHLDQHANFQRHRARYQQRYQRQQHVGYSPQRQPEQKTDHDERVNAGLDEGPDNEIAGLEDRYRSADRGWFGGQNRGGKFAQRVIVVRIAARQRLDADQAILGFPGIHELGGQGFQADRLRLQRVFELVDHDLHRVDEHGLGLFPPRLIGLGKL